MREEMLARRTSGEGAAGLIRRWIFDGELRPGARVPQDRVARELGMSRIPVREALIALDREGWVRIEMHRGVFVSSLDEDAVRDHYDLLAMVYAFAIRRATLHRAADDGDGGVAVLDELEHELRNAGDASSMSPVALAFHAAIVTAARAPRVRSLLRAMSPLVPGDFFQLDPEAFAWQRDALLAVVALIRNGDAEAAAERYLAMMRRNTQLVVDAFRSRGLFDAADSPAASGS